MERQNSLQTRLTRALFWFPGYFIIAMSKVGEQLLPTNEHRSPAAPCLHSKTLVHLSSFVILCNTTSGYTSKTKYNILYEASVADKKH